MVLKMDMKTISRLARVAAILCVDSRRAPSPFCRKGRCLIAATTS
jgi:hypothetical protein